MTTTEHTDGAHVLERLLTVCADGVEGYRLAAASVRAPHLHALLQRNEVEREEIASVLANALVELGAKGHHRGSLAGAVHRGWLGALGASHADDAIVRECTRGDQATLAAFAEALSHELPADIRTRVEVQLGRVLSALERLSSEEGTLAK
jgi:uncharacterized protein (TIGR02284 family)